jgi:septal ring-binding cell division protein DamX
VFSAPALKMIEQSSLGLTRRINILADKSLLAAFSAGSHQIGPKEIKAAIRDCEFSEATYGGKPTNRARTLWIAALLGMVALAGAIWLLAASRNDIGAPATVTVAPSVPAGDAAPTVVISAPAPQAATPLATSTTTAGAPSTPTPATLPAAATPPPAPYAATGTLPPLTAAPAEPVIVAPPPKAGPLTLARLEAGRTWLEKLPNDRWFIQLFATDADRHGEIEALLRKLSSSGTDMDKIHVYYSELSGKPRYGITYGEYSTREAAAAAMRELPKPLRAGKPYPRQVVRLR